MLWVYERARKEGYSRWRVVAKLIVLGSTNLDARIKYALAPMMTLRKQRGLARGMHSSAFEMRSYKCPDLDRRSDTSGYRGCGIARDVHYY